MRRSGSALVVFATTSTWVCREALGWMELHVRSADLTPYPDSQGQPP
jgi:hypothetical protein